MTNNNIVSAIEIDTHVKADKSVIWLHGLGADGNDFAPIVPELRMPSRIQARFIFPHAPIMPVTINQGYEMPAWFDIRSSDISDRSDTAGIQRSVGQINGIIQREMERGIDPANIMLAGFSQGAVIALTAGLLYPKRLGGIIALSGLLPNSEAVIQSSAIANRDIPIFIAHGTADGIVPLALGKRAYENLTQAGYPAIWHDYPMAHSVCAEEIRDISDWIQKIWA